MNVLINATTEEAWDKDHFRVSGTMAVSGVASNDDVLNEVIEAIVPHDAEPEAIEAELIVAAKLKLTELNRTYTNTDTFRLLCPLV